jgi:hypothetical protein
MSDFQYMTKMMTKEPSVIKKLKNGGSAGPKIPGGASEVFGKDMNTGKKGANGRKANGASVDTNELIVKKKSGGKITGPKLNISAEGNSPLKPSVADRRNAMAGAMKKTTVNGNDGDFTKTKVVHENDGRKEDLKIGKAKEPVAGYKKGGNIAGGTINGNEKDFVRTKHLSEVNQVNEDARIGGKGVANAGYKAGGAIKKKSTLKAAK